MAPYRTAFQLLGERTVRDIMTARPTCIRPDERLDIALALMTACRFRHLPVREPGENDALVGLLALRDVYRVERSHLTASRAERALHLRGIEVGFVMSQPVVTVDPACPLLDAAQLLLDREISSLPVVDDGALVGIVTRTDFLGVAAELLRAELLPRGDAVPVERLMTAKPVLTALPDDGLDLATSLMRSHNLHHLPVVENERLVGLLSDLDVLGVQSSSLDPLGPAERLAERHWTHVRDAMSTRVVTVSPDESAAEAAEVLRRRRIGCLPVLTGGRLIGILTVTDYFYYLLSHAPERKLATAQP
jgi:CBS domain-containing protein